MKSGQIAKSPKRIGYSNTGNLAGLPFGDGQFCCFFFGHNQTADALFDHIVCKPMTVMYVTDNGNKQIPG